MPPHKPYSSDLTNAQWGLLAALLSTTKPVGCTQGCDGAKLVLVHLTLDGFARLRFLGTDSCYADYFVGWEWPTAGCW